MSGEGVREGFLEELEFEVGPEGCPWPHPCNTWSVKEERGGEEIPKQRK